MDEFWILLLLLLVLAIIIVPIISLVKIFSVGSRLEDVERELKQLKALGGKISSAMEEKVKSPSEKNVIIEQPQVSEVQVTKEVEVPVEKVEEPLPAPVIVEAQKVVPEESKEELQEKVLEEVIEEVHETVHEEIRKEIDPLPDVVIPVAVEVEEPEPVYLGATAQNDSEVPVFTMPSTESETPKTENIPPRVTPKKKPFQKESLPFRFENLLSKIGIVTLVLGIAFFVKYAIDKDWINEVGRVAIGVLTGGVLIGIAHKLRKKYDVFSALMVGGGISVLYITITLAFREYHLFDQTLAFIILIAITIFSVILSLVYDRKELALFSLLGGYASPLMISTGEGNYVVLFSFLFILNSGMLAISMRKKWGIIGIVSFVCTQLFYWVWLMNSFEIQYTGALTFGILFFVQFYLLALFDHFLSDRKISPFQVCVILANNLSLFAASIYIFNETEMKVQGLITLAMAFVNAIVMIALFRKATVDKRLIYLIISIVLSFVSLAIPVQLNGHVITMFWAAEIVILLWLWQKSHIKVFQVGFILISVLTLFSYFMDAYHIYFDLYDPLPVVFNRIFMTGLVVIVAFVVSRFMLNKENNSANGIGDVTTMKRLWAIVIWGMTYLVPFLEIYYQFDNSTQGISGFTPMMLAVYTTIYVAVLSLVFRKKIQEAEWGLASLFIFIVLYLAVALPIMIDLREDVFYTGEFIPLFLTHYLALPALGYIFYIAARNIHKLSKQVYTLCGWGLVISAVVILSVELDNYIVQIWGTASNYDDLLFDVHTFGYPILWGILAMILMIWGLKAKEALLRQISLGFFGFIILKFYTTDIWLMSQTGRIISFVALGVILLLVSFLIQKIKVLIKDDEEEPKETEK